MKIFEKLGIEHPFMDACALMTIIMLLVGLFSRRAGAWMAYAFDHLWWFSIPAHIIGILGVAWIAFGLFFVSLAFLDWLK